MRISVNVGVLCLVACACGHQEPPPRSGDMAAEERPEVAPELQGIDELRASSCPPGSSLREPSDSVTISVNGRVAAACMKPDGTHHGASMAWHANKTKANAGEYREGKREGAWTYWHENGRISGRGFFRDGKPQGAWVTWHPNQEKESEGSYVDGRHHGRFTHWDRQGRVLKVLQYAHGELTTTNSPAATHAPDGR